jgi:hypothetical protein
VRLRNKGLYAGFTSARDLPFFLERICGAEYRHELRLAPTEDLLYAERRGEIGWLEYERRFISLMAERNVERTLQMEDFRKRTVVLCREATPEKCHRRLVVEYLADRWGSPFHVRHL